jgi:hypothetical protein
LLLQTLCLLLLLLLLMQVFEDTKAQLEGQPLLPGNSSEVRPAVAVPASAATHCPNNTILSVLVAQGSPHLLCVAFLAQAVLCRTLSGAVEAARWR